MTWLLVLLGLLLVACGVGFVIFDAHRSEVRHEEAGWERLRRETLEEEF